MTRYFLDCEFNGMGGNLISLAMVSDGGQELYAATSCLAPIPWVGDNVIPVVRCAGADPISCSRSHFGLLITEFLDTDIDPIIIADWPDDIAYFCKALIVAPGQMVGIPSIKFEMHRVDAYPTTLPGAIQHNALWDARALRHKLMEKYA